MRVQWKLRWFRDAIAVEDRIACAGSVDCRKMFFLFFRIIDKIFEKKLE